MLWMGIWCTLTLLRLCRAGSGVDFRKIELSPSPRDVVMSWLRLQTRMECIPHPCHMYTKCCNTLICRGWAYGCALTLLPILLGSYLWCCVTCGVNMMWLCHGWGWQPPETDFHIHITHIQSVWAPWYAVHWHTAALLHLHSIRHTNWIRFWGSSLLVKSTWCHNVVVEAEGHLKLTLVCCPWAYSSSLTQYYAH